MGSPTRALGRWPWQAQSDCRMAPRWNPSGPARRLARAIDCELAHKTHYVNSGGRGEGARNFQTVPWRTPLRRLGATSLLPESALVTPGPATSEEELGEALHALCDARVRCVEHRGHALVHRLRDDDVAGHQAIGLHLQRALDLADAEPHPGVGPVQHQLELARGDVEQAQIGQADLHVLDAGDVHPRDEQDVVALLEHGADD